MDPASLVTALCKCSYQIYNYVQQSRVVDQRLQALKRQVDGLAVVLRSLGDLFAREVVRDQASRNHQLWKAVAQALEGCFAVVRELDQKLEDVGASSSRRGVFHRAVKTGRMALNKADVERLLSALQTHSINLQLAVGIVQLLVTASNPGAVAHELVTRLDRLERMIIMVDERLAIQGNSQASHALHENILSTVQLDDNTKTLRRSATDVLSSASTSASTQLSDTTYRATAQHRTSVFEFIEVHNPPGTETITAREESTTGSEFGSPMQPSQRSEIRDWILTSRIDDVVGEPENAAPQASTASPSDPLASVIGDLSVSSDLNLADDSIDLFDEDSDDDELQVHVIQSFFTRGKAMVEAGDFNTGEDMIGRGLKDALSLTRDHKMALDLQQMQLLYTLCCTKCGKHDVAEDILLAMTKEHVQDTATVARVLHAYHGLALLYLARGNLEAAITNCRQALNNRRRAKSIGKTHADYIASLRLFALLTWAEGDKVRAEAYSEMLPEGQKIAPAEFNTILDSEFGYVAQQMSSSLYHPDPNPSASWNTQDQIETSPENIAIDVTDRKRISEPKKLLRSPTELANIFHWKNSQTLKGHSDWVWAVAFSPNGKQIVSGSDDKSIRLWDVATGAARSKLEGHSDSVWAVAFSPNGKQIVSGSYDKSIRLWDVATRAARSKLEGHSDWVGAVAFSPDGKQIVSGSDDKSIRLWDVATGAARSILNGHSDWVWAVAFSPDGKQIVSGSDDKSIRLWDVATGAARSKLEGHSGSVLVVAFSPDGKQIVSGSSDKSIRLWEMTTETPSETSETRS